jgi:hypothetical protein
MTRRLLTILWALPYTIFGMVVGLCGLGTGGHIRRRGIAIEFFGGFTAWFVRHLPAGGQSAIAITLGHTILGQTGAGLDIARQHEWVHVRQYECRGPLMGPAYLLCSLWLWLTGKNPYADNYFEREASRLEGGSKGMPS